MSGVATPDICWSTRISGYSSGSGSVGLEGGGTAARLGHLGGLQRGLVEVAVLLPPLLAGGGEGVDRVVVLVRPRQRLWIRGLDGGAVVLGPVRDAALGVVVGELVDPSLADERDVADDPRRREPGQ